MRSPIANSIKNLDETLNGLSDSEAAESKENLDELNVPYIRVKGRKGGSTVAAAIVNALMYNVVER